LSLGAERDAEDVPGIPARYATAQADTINADPLEFVSS
jgi:hypothetical protein